MIVHDSTLPCGLWKLGRVQEVLNGRDGRPRAALVRLSSRDRQHIFLKRPLQLLYPLEIRTTEMLEPNSKEMPTSNHNVYMPAAPEDGDVPTLNVPERRPTRAAARKARETIGAWAEELNTSELD